MKNRPLLRDRVINVNGTLGYLKTPKRPQLLLPYGLHSDTPRLGARFFKTHGFSERTSIPNSSNTAENRPV